MTFLPSRAADGHVCDATRLAAAIGCDADCGAGAREPDAWSAAAAKREASDQWADCPWHVAVSTRSYGTGDESQDDDGLARSGLRRATVAAYAR
jgi:hypothetical protein